MTEQLLHYCWKHRLFPLTQLATTDGQLVEVIDTGLHNSDAGPDFINAKIKLADTVWVGNVEIHNKSSDWYAHHHDQDTNYNNVVLHVSGDVDTPVRTTTGREIPQLELQVPQQVEQQYEQLLMADAYPPCHEVVSEMPRITVHAWLSALQTERLEQKTLQIKQRLALCQGDWETVLFVTLARNFGFGVNGDAFEQWAMHIPLHSVAHHRDDLFQVEAFFMGQAGLLERSLIPEKYHETMDTEGYFERLQNEYLYLQHKFNLQPMEGKRWKFLRLRPQNFPNIRIAQLATLYHSHRFGLRNLVESESLKALKDTMKSGVSTYWQTHYVFGAVSKKSEKRISESSLNVLLINTVIPILFAYGRYHDEEELCDKALNYLEQLQPETNHIIRKWQESGIKVENAGDTQALVQLQRQYCERKECLRCRFGYEYLKGKQHNR